MTGEKIMIVDDNKEFLSELKETLFLCGYEAKGVSDSLAAIKLAHKLKPDIILLDLRMNRMNGFKVAEQLKNSEATRDIPIVAMSGYFPLERSAVLLDLSNMDERIEKPFSVSDLISLIERVYKKRRPKA